MSHHAICADATCMLAHIRAPEIYSCNCTVCHLALQTRVQHVRLTRTGCALSENLRSAFVRSVRSRVRTGVHLDGETTAHMPHPLHRSMCLEMILYLVAHPCGRSSTKRISRLHARCKYAPGYLACAPLVSQCFQHLIQFFSF